MTPKSTQSPSSNGRSLRTFRGIGFTLSPLPPSPWTPERLNAKKHVKTRMFCINVRKVSTQSVSSWSPLRLSRKVRQKLYVQITFSHHPLPLQRAVSFRIPRESAKRTQLPSEVARNVEGYAIRQTLLDFFQITFSHHPLPLQRAVSFTILGESAKRTQLPSEVAGNVPSQIYM